MEKTNTKRSKLSSSRYSSSFDPNTSINVEKEDFNNTSYNHTVRPISKKPEERKMKKVTINEPTPIVNYLKIKMEEKAEKT